jgi:uncharacterized protein
MSFSLYDAVVPSQLQMLGATLALLDKAEAHCAGTGLAPAELLGRRLAADMHPLAYQFKSVAVHSLGAMEGVRAGRFAPDTSDLPDSFAPLRERLAAARAALEAIEPAELNGYEGREVDFHLGTLVMPFTAENFLLSFSQPNFYFHCSIVYALLRAEGLAIGKRDFVHRPRMRPRP